MRTKAPLLGALLFQIACAMPSTQVVTPDSRPKLAIVGAPKGSVLIVDGRDVGDATLYGGQSRVLTVEPGTHWIAVRDASGTVVYDQKVFLESELKTIQVH